MLNQIDNLLGKDIFSPLSNLVYVQSIKSKLLWQHSPVWEGALIVDGFNKFEIILIYSISILCQNTNPRWNI